MEGREPGTDPRPAQSEDRPDASAAPEKRHGDALLDGSGSRHGAVDPDERPELGASSEEEPSETLHATDRDDRVPEERS